MQGIDFKATYINISTDEQILDDGESFNPIINSDG